MGMHLFTTSLRTTRRKTTWQVTAAVFLVLWGILGVVVSLQKAFVDQEISRVPYAATGSIVLGATTNGGNCSPPAIHQFPADVFSQAQRTQGAVIVHVIVTLYMFLALAIVCDDYFVPALERISEGLNLQPDVAGATFMAAGSSAPEVFTSIFGVFISRDDIGVGTIVGSAVFNLLFIVGLCGLMVGTAITLTIWPLVRDCSVYLISVGALILVMYNGKVHWYEAVAMLVLYFLYVVLMYFNRSLGTAFTRWFPTTAPTETPGHNVNEETLLVIAEGEKGTEKKMVDFAAPPVGSATAHSDEADTPKAASPLSVPSSFWRRVLWLLGLPLTVLLVCTVPDCRRDRWKRWYPLSFVMSVAWIGAFTYILVWMVTIIGFTLGVPDTVMGLTLLAIGTSLPDAISSVLVCKEGEGDMAVSNAVGSNVFDILIGLGAPWFLKTVVVYTNNVVPIRSEGLIYSSVMLLSTVLVLLTALWLNRWRLDRKLGVVCGLLYAFFITMATLYELNVIGDFNPPTCPNGN